jgi:hypothetical protein
MMKINVRIEFNHDKKPKCFFLLETSLKIFKMGRPKFLSRQYVLSNFPPRRRWLKMHPRILFTMFTILSTEDAICFALSCKFTLAYYIEILKGRGKTMSATPQPKYAGVKMLPWMRIRLLRRLQNSRWKYCAQCWILHPRSVWNTQPFWRLDHKVCSYGCHTLGNRKCYLPYAGEFDLCPCSHLNIHHKLLLISRFQNKLYNNGAWVSRHTCTFNRHPVANVQIKVSFFFACQEQSLRVRTRFIFDFKKSTPSQLKKFRNRRRDISMYENPGKWVAQFFLDVGNFFGGRMDWEPCQWLSWDVHDGGREFVLNRNLGMRVWPSESWIRNCR